MLAYNDATGGLIVWTGTAWVPLTSGGGGGGAVSSVAGRTGAVTLAVADVSGAAPLASPALTGSPTAPTQTAGDNSTKLATTAFVQGQGFATAAGAAAAAPVQSVAGRTGAVTLAVADVSGRRRSLRRPSRVRQPGRRRRPATTRQSSPRRLSSQRTILSASNAPALGIGTAADRSNPLSAKLNSALFTALPTSSSGTGDIRVKLSKQAAGNTASFLFQDNFSGRAEIGLTGDDNFHFKVSADGTTFYDAIVVTAAGGAVAFLGTPTHPTPATADNSTKSATTAYVQAQGYVTASGAAAAAPVQSVAGRTGAVTLAVADVSGAAPLASPAFSGSPTAPKPSAGDSSTKIATTAFVASVSAPVQSVAGRTGAVTLAVADVSGAAPLASPAFSGAPTAPTPTAGDSSTKIATTAFVASVSAPVQSVAGRTGTVTLAVADVSGAAPLASPAFSGTPTAPTPTVGDGSTKIATTALRRGRVCPGAECGRSHRHRHPGGRRRVGGSAARLASLFGRAPRRRRRRPATARPISPRRP